MKTYYERQYINNTILYYIQLYKQYKIKNGNILAQNLFKLPLHLTPWKMSDALHCGIQSSMSCTLYYIFKEVRVICIQNEMSDENRFLKTNRVFWDSKARIAVPVVYFKSIDATPMSQIRRKWYFFLWSILWESSISSSQLESYFRAFPSREAPDSSTESAAQSLNLIYAGVTV